jgi:hypothetical protein
MATTASAESLHAEPLPVEPGLPPVERGKLPVDSDVLYAELKLLPAEAKEEWYWIERAKASSIQTETLILLHEFSNICSYST